MKNSQAGSATRESVLQRRLQHLAQQQRYVQSPLAFGMLKRMGLMK